MVAFHFQVPSPSLYRIVFSSLDFHCIVHFLVAICLANDSVDGGDVLCPLVSPLCGPSSHGSQLVSSQFNSRTSQLNRKLCSLAFTLESKSINARRTLFCFYAGKEWRIYIELCGYAWGLHPFTPTCYAFCCSTFFFIKTQGYRLLLI